MRIAKKRTFTLLSTLFSGSFIPLMAQSAEGHNHQSGDIDFNLIFSMLEIPFLILVIVLSFAVAQSLKGGKFGAGMSLVAWGFLVMAIGHIHMQIEHLTGHNLFKDLLGPQGGTFAWFAALIVTWSLSGIGFYKLYKASRLS